jgi:MFS family permease
MYLLGWVSLFADLCHEGMRSILGPYLTMLGASATAVGLVAGTGEAIGYVLRYVTGAVADRTQRYWALTIAGYACNLIAVPMLALAGSWPMVAALVGLERLGKAVRSPAKSTLTSFVAPAIGAGRVFAIVEAMDQAGALTGPLLVAAVLAWRGDTASGFAWAFALLGLPAVATLALLGRARRLYPDPRKLEDEPAPGLDAAKAALSPRYAVYLVGAALVAIGLADWPLLAYHLQGGGAISARWLPVVYAAAMGADGLASLVAGLLFDRSRGRGGTGAGVIAVFVALGAAYAPLVFAANASATPLYAIAGIALWAMARAATESIGKALIAAIVPAGARGRAYGLYYLVWGGAWWAGSVALGALYDHARGYTSLFAVSAMVAGAVVIGVSARRAAAPAAA